MSEPRFLTRLDKSQRMLTVTAIKILLVFSSRPRGSSFCVTEIMEETGIKSGTLVGVLSRFKRDEWVEAEWETGSASMLGRPLRHFYRLSDKGRMKAFVLIDELRKMIKMSTERQ